eukprot:3653034-Pyramimonas_sp.AAC.1
MPGGWIKAGTLADGDLLNDTLESELIEAAAYDDDDASQGTYILQVLHGDYAPEGGVLLTARYLAAKDDYYNYWMRSGGRPIKDVYHVCAAAGVLEATRPRGHRGGQARLGGEARTPETDSGGPARGG